MAPAAGAVISSAAGDVEIASVTFAADRQEPVPVTIAGGQSIVVTVAAPGELAMVLARTGTTVTVCGAL